MTAVAFSPPVQPNSTVSMPYALAQWGVPCGTAPNADWNNGSGNFTLGTALNEVYRRGLWLRFAGVGVNSSTGGPESSGLYWCVMNSTTEGQAYALSSITISTTVPVTTGATAFTPFVPLASQLNGLLPTTAGTHVQSTGTQITVANVTIPANSMGANGVFRVLANASNNNSAGTKTLRDSVGGVSLININNTTATGGVLANQTRNRNIATAQISSVNSYGINSSPVFTTFDTTSDVALLWQISITTATDWMILQGATVEILPAS